MTSALNTAKAPTAEAVLMEIAVAASLREKYGTNQPDKAYEDGVMDALLWVLGGKQPQLVEDDQSETMPVIAWEKAPENCVGYSVGTAGSGYWVTYNSIGTLLQPTRYQHALNEVGFYRRPCNGCGKTGGGKCPDCGAVMGDATYAEMLGAGVFAIGGFKA
jgi:hypothetical protein